MAGFYCYGNSSYREYIGASIPPLTVWNTYKVTIRISLADSAKYGIAGVGVYFYRKAKPDSFTIHWVGNVPQINYSFAGVVTDKIKWTTLSATFIADSAYDHLVIGNFQSDAAVTAVSTPTFGYSFSVNSYYYIDSVAVESEGVLATRTAPCPSDYVFYPNPAREQLTIAGPTVIHSVAVIDMLGREKFRKPDVNAANFVADVSSLPKGIYMIRIEDRIIGEFAKE
jgi:hypothetical protein